MPSRHGDGWSARWTDETGSRRRETFRLRKDADAFERRKKIEAEERRSGLRPPSPPTKTFGDLCDRWVETRASQKRSGKHDESIIRAHLRPVFGAVRLIEFGTAHVDAFVVSRAGLSAKTVHNHITLLISILNLAIDLGWLVSLPRIRKPRVQVFAEDFSYLRTDEEVRRFLRAAREHSESVFRLYATAIYTGMRAGELAGLRRSAIDLTRRLITVQRSYDGPTKAGDVRYIPILDALLPVLDEGIGALEPEPMAIVFPNESGEMLGRSARAFQEILHRVLRDAGLPPRHYAGGVRPYIRFHDLRHTFASHWVMKGGDLFKLQKVLGHKTVQMTMRYAHLAPHAFAEDFDRFGSIASDAKARC